MMDADARLMPHAVAQMDAIADLLADAKYTARAQHICAMLRNNPDCVRYTDIYHLLTDNWDALCQWSSTYRLLSDIAVMQQWRDDNDARADLCQIITDMSAAWHD